jgi:DNA-binding CsgD family transcriptional regulator
VVVWPLIGRDRELELVRARLSADAAGGVVLAGAAGVGKTRLATEVSQLADSAGRAVEWVRATRSTASIPLGAFAPLLPAEASSADGAELLARARHALVERAGGGGLVLCVDDGQLLDDLSAALVHQLVAAREAFAVVTLRVGDPAPDALRALWKDELCDLVEIGTLAREEVDRLLAAVLGAPMHGRSGDALWRLTLGNALFLREMVLYGVERGLLAEAGGIWHWHGEMAAGMRLAELVGARLESLDEAALAVLETVAVGVPLETALLEPDELRALEELERHGIVERGLDGRRELVDVAHPLHGEVVRARLSRTRMGEIQRRLADAVEAHGARRRADVPRLAGWRLESGGARHPELFERAAVYALAAYDVALAERFARAAVEAGGGFAAQLALGRALAGEGRAAEAEDHFEELVGRERDDEERVALAIAIARNLYWGLGRTDDAQAALLRAEQTVTDGLLRDELVAQRIRLLSAGGSPREALAEARSLLADENAREQVRVHAALAASEALVATGRTNEAIEVAETWLPVARRHNEERPPLELVPLLELVLLSLRAIAMRLDGRLVEATEISAPLYERAVRQRSVQNNAVESSSLGYIWLARGRVETAARFFRESAALLRDADATGMFPWAVAGLAQAAAQAGDAAVARDAVAELKGRHQSQKGFETELDLGRAWSAAAAGELSRARELAGAAAELARSRDQSTFELRALHELCRLGGAPEAAERLSALAAEVDGAFGPTAAAHAAALVAGDPRALMEVAERFADMDALLVAAEAADAAAAAFREAGRAASARSASARAALWLESCEGARPPTLGAGQEATELTPREREVAMLAAGGLSSREIAERLVVSVRTVDNHLQRVYRKLGVTRRDELPKVLTGAAE